MASDGRPSIGLFIAVNVFGTLWCPASGYPAGAPFSTCLTMFPKHGPTQRQLEVAPPYLVTVNPSTYRPGQIITVELKSRDGRPLRGLQIRATRSTGDKESALGTFVQIPVNITKVFTCEGGYKNMVTHTEEIGLKSSTLLVNTVTLSWKAPETNVGNIEFVATFVEQYDKFWTGVKAFLDSEDPLGGEPPMFEGVAPVDLNKVQFESCGQDKGCFLYPRYCSGDNCLAAVSFREDGDYFRFELMAHAATYVSIGISNDVRMGEDETITCTADDHLGIQSVQHGYNPHLFNLRIVKDQLSDFVVNRTDGKVLCSFRRPRVTVARVVNQAASSLQFINTTFDLSREYYLMLAWGTVKIGSDVINKHKELPPITDSKVSFREYTIYRGSSLPWTARTHAFLMVVAWVLVVGVSTLTTRYYKHWLATREFCGTSIWFQIHRGAGVVAGLLTIASVILMIVYLGGYAYKEEKHAIVGFTVLSLVCLQILGGFLRPDKSSDYRPYFKWGHMILGQSAHILSAVAMFLAFNIRFIPSDMSSYGVAVITGWVTIQIAWTIVMELRRCCIAEKDVKETATLMQDLKSVDSLLYLCYFITLVLLATVTLCIVLVF